MMSQPLKLARFLQTFTSQRSGAEEFELIINGDFIDFLAIPPFSSWTHSPDQIRSKFHTLADGPCGVVFEALGTLVSSKVDLTILVGNHDLELALPSAQQVLLDLMHAPRHAVQFIDDGRAYRVGRCLIEHGNRYDGANMNDWGGVRAVAASQSRNEEPSNSVSVSAGSEVVIHIVNQLKTRYPFVDLIQPQNELVLLLLMCFEPSIVFDAAKLWRIVPAKVLSGRTAPWKTSQTRASLRGKKGSEISHLFEKELARLSIARSERGARDWLHVFAKARADSISEAIRTDQRIDVGLLTKIQVILRALLMYDTSFDFDASDDPCAAAAYRMHSADTELVLMGHTHLARRVGPAGRRRYINTGTWADLIEVPQDALTRTSAGLLSLESFLAGLLDNQFRLFKPAHADVLIADDGSVAKAELRGGVEWTAED